MFKYFLKNIFGPHITLATHIPHRHTMHSVYVHMCIYIYIYILDKDIEDRDIDRYR